MRRPITLFITSLALILALSGCGGDDTDVASPGTGTETDEPAPEPGDEPVGDPECIGETGESRPDYVGLSEAQAAERAEDEGYTVRVVGEDGECFPITDDLRENRVNVELADGWVIAAAIY